MYCHKMCFCLFWKYFGFKSLIGTVFIVHGPAPGLKKLEMQLANQFYVVFDKCSINGHVEQSLGPDNQRAMRAMGKNRVLWNCEYMKNVSCLVLRFCWWVICRITQYSVSIDRLWLIRVKRPFYWLGLIRKASALRIRSKRCLGIKTFQF